MSDPAGTGDDAWLDRLQHVADPAADATIAQIVGPWQRLPAGASMAQLRIAHQPQWSRLAAATRLLQGIEKPAAGSPGGTLASRIGDDPAAPGVGAALRAFVAQAEVLPDWADPARIAVAEQIFIDYGALSCVLLFCASLPECYVVPDLSIVLNASGQLEERTDYRIRMTAAMIFPVMMPGGLGAGGAGVAQILKVRLIHATIRNLILHGPPAGAIAALAVPPQRLADGSVVDPACIDPQPALQEAPGMVEAMFGLGWDVHKNQLPCNQEELGYTLLTFGYVFVRSLRLLGIPLASAQEEAFLHCWNVAGSVLGIERDLLPESMSDCARLFALMQARGRADHNDVDVRPRLGRALVETMASRIPFALLKPMPLLMLRHLCGPATARDLGLDAPVSIVAGALFTALVWATRAVDATVRVVVSDFSISRFLTRLIGYQLMTRILMQQARPLALPENLRADIDTMMDAWADDPKAPRWLNRIEDRFTTPGSWRTAPGRPAPRSG